MQSGIDVAQTPKKPITAKCLEEVIDERVQYKVGGT